MPRMTDFVAVGFGAEKAKVLSEEKTTSAPTRTVNTGLTAAGTTITDALALTRFINIIGTAALNTGAKLPSVWPIGQWGLVQNNGANPINLFPPTASLTINGGSAGAAVTIAAAAGNLIIRHSATDFGAYVLAKEA